MEIWRDAVGFPKYEVSNYGNVRHKEKKKILNGGLTTKGYKQVCLRDENDKQKTPKVHVLVAKAFIPNPENKPMVNHKDSNRLNNHVDNLEWSTNGENQQHAFAVGFQDNKGEEHPSAVLTEEDVRYIYTSIITKKHTSAYFVRKYDVSKGTISSIKNKRNWTHVTDKIDEEMGNKVG